VLTTAAISYCVTGLVIVAVILKRDPQCRQQATQSVIAVLFPVGMVIAAALVVLFVAGGVGEVNHQHEYCGEFPIVMQVERLHCEYYCDTGVGLVPIPEY